MASVLKVDKLDPQSGTALEIGTSGDTISIPSGVTIANSGTATGFGAVLTGSTNNQVTTVTAANAITGETNLIYDGTILGVGAAGADADLGAGIHIKAGDSGGGAYSWADELVIENSSAGAGITILTNNDQEASIAFGDSDHSAKGKIQYNHASDSYEFTNNAIGTMKIDSTGAMTKPYQPAFRVLSTSTANVTGDDTAYSIDNSANWGAEAFDQGGDLASTGIFTAPITGRYYLSASWQFGGITSSHTRGTLTITTSNRSYYLYFDPYSLCEKSGNTVNVSGSWLADMDASDTAFLKLTVYNGAKVIDMSDETMWGGFLAC